MPPVELFWYDGVENIPPLPKELGQGATLTRKEGKFIYSKTLTFEGGTHGDTLRILPEDRMREMAGSLPKIVGGFSDHTVNFILACQGKEESRSPFHVSGPLTQVLLLGVIAQRLGGRLVFDPVTRDFVGNAEANRLLAGPPPRKGWEQYYADPAQEREPRGPQTRRPSSPVVFIDSEVPRTSGLKTHLPSCPAAGKPACASKRQA